MDRVADIAGAIVFVALVTTLVSSPRTAQQITALGNAFSGSIRAALGPNAGR